MAQPPDTQDNIDMSSSPSTLNNEPEPEDVELTRLQSYLLTAEEDVEIAKLHLRGAEANVGAARRLVAETERDAETARSELEAARRGRDGMRAREAEGLGNREFVVMQEAGCVDRMLEAEDVKERVVEENRRLRGENEKLKTEIGMLMGRLGVRAHWTGGEGLHSQVGSSRMGRVRPRIVVSASVLPPIHVDTAEELEALAAARASAAAEGEARKASKRKREDDGGDEYIRYGRYGR
jgi:hypothetical protein